MSGPPTVPGRRPPLLLVVLALVLACLTVGAGTAYLLRPPMTADELAVARAVPSVSPQAPVGREEATGLHVYLVPHPDDELSGWTSLVDAPGLYPVVVLLTAGEETQRCTPDGPSGHLQTELGEVPPEPYPAAGGGSAACGQARLGSFRAALDAAAEHSPVVAGLGADDGRAVDLDLGAGTLTVGAHASLVALDLGDGRLSAAAVRTAVLEVLALRGNHLPDLPISRVTASAYVAHGPDERREDAGGDGRERDGGGCVVRALCPEDDGPYVYAHPDHLATHEAARALAPEAEEGAWLVTSTYDRAAEVHRALSREMYDAFVALGSGGPDRAERIGSYQRIYGWLAFPDVWRPGDLPLDSEQVLFPRVQSFEVVRP